MNTHRKVVLALTVLLCTTALFGQERRDRAVIEASRNEFLDTLRAGSERFRKGEEEPKTALRMDFATVSAPSSPEEFRQQWHNPPISQGITGMCWCYSTTSFLETEIHRLTDRKLKLSEPYTVYWEYVEKARGFVRTRGESYFGQGSEANAVTRIWKEYGIVPLEAYTGLQDGQRFHDHDSLFVEMENYLDWVRTADAWNEEEVLATIRAVLNHYLGEPPRRVRVGGRELTPQQYLKEEVRLNMDDYVDFLSLMEKPYYRKVEFGVPDNWWEDDSYHNVPLDVFMSIIRNAIRDGFTLSIGGDTSEPGYEGHAGIGVIPTFDIPSDYIDESSRQHRFSNGTTEDDHGIHLVGYLEKDGKDWYLVKDSGSSSRNNSHPGYYFHHEDFAKLKMLGFMVHKDAARKVLERFQQ
ncbi:MAG: C1 family peptidase [Bacteroidota bacterium]